MAREAQGNLSYQGVLMRMMIINHRRSVLDARWHHEDIGSSALWEFFFTQPGAQPPFSPDNSPGEKINLAIDQSVIRQIVLDLNNLFIIITRKACRQHRLLLPFDYAFLLNSPRTFLMNPKKAHATLKAKENPIYFLLSVTVKIYEYKPRVLQLIYQSCGHAMCEFKDNILPSGPFLSYIYIYI